MSDENIGYTAPTAMASTYIIPVQAKYFPVSGTPPPVLAHLVEDDMQRIRAMIAEEVAKALKEAKESE